MPRKPKRTTADKLFDNSTATQAVQFLPPNPVEELLVIMRRNGCSRLEIPGSLILNIDTAAFIGIEQPVKTMTIPNVVPPAERELFRELSDAELLTAHLPPELEPIGD